MSQRFRVVKWPRFVMVGGRFMCCTSLVAWMIDEPEAIRVGCKWVEAMGW